MCLIIHKPADQEIPYWIVESAALYNADGVGIMLNGAMQKWPNKSAQSTFDELEKLKGQELAIHFRMATHGKVNRNNTHPFRLANSGYLMHNGILTYYAAQVKKKSGQSDTALFVSKFCNPLIKEHGSIPRKALESEIVGNAICIMHPDGAIKRYGTGWVKHDGLWFSNEYAWDAPITYSSYSYASYDAKQPTWADSLDIGGFDDANERVIVDGSIDDHVCKILDLHQDQLDLASPDHIAYEDMEIYDGLFDGTIHVVDFIYMCTAQTCMNLYNQLVRAGHIS